MEIRHMDCSILDSLTPGAGPPGRLVPRRPDLDGPSWIPE